MKKLLIEFEITSTDSSVAFTVTGEFKNNRIIFTDEDNNKNYIVFHNEVIEYYKKGSVDMKYVFDLQKVTKGRYQVENHSFDFDIETKKLKSTSNSLEIEYTLFQNNEIANESILKVSYSITKEE